MTFNDFSIFYYSIIYLTISLLLDIYIVLFFIIINNIEALYLCHSNSYMFQYIWLFPEEKSPVNVIMF